MIRYDLGPDRATITIDDPERRNPLSNAAMREIRDAVLAANAAPDVRVIVITGAGDKVFSAGGDLAGAFVDEPLGDHAGRGALADLFRTLQRGRKPTIARVNGDAFGGGFGLAAACDLTVAVRGATLGTPEIDIGLWPMMISAALLPLAPRRAVLEMMLLGQRLSAEAALGLGFVNRVVEPGELDEAVDDLVGALASRSPAALELGKRAFYAVADMDFDTALDHLHAGLTATATTDDAAEGIAAFMEKRQPRWRGT